MKPATGSDEGKWGRRIANLDPEPRDPESGNPASRDIESKDAESGAGWSWILTTEQGFRIHDM